MREGQEQMKRLKRERKRQGDERREREKHERCQKWKLEKEEENLRRQRESESGIIGPGRADLAFSSRHDFTESRYFASGSGTLSSRPAEESFLSYSYRMGREKLSLHESAPGSLWAQRLSAERMNRGWFAGVLRKG